VIKLQGYKHAYRQHAKNHRILPEAKPMPDEIEAIRLGRDEISRGETVNHDDIDWN